MYGMHAAFPGVNYSSNDVMLNGMSKYLLFSNFEEVWYAFFYDYYIKPNFYSEYICNYDLIK